MNRKYYFLLAMMFSIFPIISMNNTTVMKKLIDRRDFVEIILNKRREERENSDYLIRYFLIQYFYNSRIKKLEQRLKILNVQIEEATDKSKSEKIKWQNFVNEYDNTTGLIKDKYACHSCDE